MVSIYHNVRDWPRCYKTLFMSTHLSMKFIKLIHVKVSTIEDILTFMSLINTTSKSLKARKVLIFHHLRFYEQLKFHDQLS